MCYKLDKNSLPDVMQVYLLQAGCVYGDVVAILMRLTDKHTNYTHSC